MRWTALWLAANTPCVSGRRIATVMAGPCPGQHWSAGEGRSCRRRRRGQSSGPVLGLAETRPTRQQGEDTTGPTREGAGPNSAAA